MQNFHLDKLTTDNAYKATLQGDVFQLKILMITAFRALKSGAAQFMINTEVTAAEKFDDLVAEYSNNTVTVLQAKHSSKSATYDKNDFIAPPKGEASLAKYFDSFVKLREKEFVGGKPINYIFFTNRKIAAGNFLTCLQRTAEPDANLKFAVADASCWQFKPAFYENTPEFQSIYAEITAAIKQNSKCYYQWLTGGLTIDATMHQIALEAAAQKVIDYIVAEIQKIYPVANGTGYTVSAINRAVTHERNLLISVLENLSERSDLSFTMQFCDNQNLSPFQLRLRTHLILKLQNVLHIHETAVVQLLKNLKISYPKDILTFTWEPKPQANQTNKVVLVNLGNGNFSWNPTLEEAHYIVGMFGDFSIPYSPGIEKPLSHLTIYNTLHKAILTEIKVKQGGNADAVELKFATELKEFFKAYRIKTGQPNEAQLEAILQNEMQVHFNFSGPEYYAQFFTTMMSWMKDFNAKVIDRNIMERFLKYLTVGIQRLHLTGYSEHTIGLLESSTVRVTIDPLTTKPISDYCTEDTAKNLIMLLTGEDKLALTLTIAKIIRMLKENKHLMDDNWGFIDSKCRILDKVLEILLYPKFKLLVIDDAEKLLRQQPEIFRKIVNTAITNNRKLIFLCESVALELIQAEIPKDRLLQQHLPLLSDAEVDAICDPHKNKHVYIGGRYISIAAIIAHKQGGIYEVMHQLTQLDILLSTAISLSELAESKSETAYVPQLVRHYSTYYDLETIFAKLPKNAYLHMQLASFNQILLIIPKTIQLDYAKAKQYLENTKELTDKQLILQNATTKQNEEDLVDAVIIINTKSIELNSQIQILITFLRNHNHTVILVNENLEIKLENLRAVTITCRQGRIVVNEDDMHLFGKPHFTLTPNDEQPYNDLHILTRSKENLTTCITANPGTGKSENFRHLVRQWQTTIELDKQYHWLIPLNLIDIDETYLHKSLETILFDCLLRFHTRSINAKQQQLCLLILKLDMRNGRIKLLLDGLDEVQGLRKDIVEQFISQIPKEVHYDIAMRPYVFSDAPCMIYRRAELLPFKDVDFQDYLQRRFSAILNNKAIPIDDIKLSVFIKRVLSWLYESEQELMDVIKLPLIAFLLSESLQLDWLAYAQDVTEKIPEGPWDEEANLTLASLFELFVFSRARIYLQRFVGIVSQDILNNDIRVLKLCNNILMTMQALAFSELFEQQLEESQNIDDILYRDLLDFGIISGRVLDQLDNTAIYRYIFIQQTLKEFFAALFIVNALSKTKTNTYYKIVVNELNTKRYESRYKIIWRFVKDLLRNNTNLLGKKLDSIDAKIIFTTPKDFIGVAENNLLSELGLCDETIKIHEMSRTAISTIASNSDETVIQTRSLSTDELLALLSELENNIGSRDTAISLISKLPDIIPDAVLNRYHEVIKKALCSWSYRVYGHMASKISKLSEKIPVDFLGILRRIVFDKNCYSTEQQSAIEAMSKVNPEGYPQLVAIYFELLQLQTVNNVFKNQILKSIQFILPNITQQHNEIVTLCKKGFPVEAKPEELFLRRLLLIKLITKESLSYPDQKSATPVLISAVSGNFSLSTLDLLFDLMENQFISVEVLQKTILQALLESDNRHQASAWFLAAYQKLQQRGMDINFLACVLNATSQIRNSTLLVKTALENLEKGTYEWQGENFLRFWRLDAGILIAISALDTPLAPIGLSYLLHQIRHNMYEYDVTKNLLYRISCFIQADAIHRSHGLLLTLEYLIFAQPNFGNYRYFQHLDSKDSLIGIILHSAWQHFVDDSHHPLLGLEVIFAVGAFYGLPLQRDNNQLIMYFPNITSCKIMSPKLTDQQLAMCEHHFKTLRDRCGPRFDIQQLRLQSDLVGRLSVLGKVKVADIARQLLFPPPNLVADETVIISNERKSKRLSLGN